MIVHKNIIPGDPSPPNIFVSDLTNPSVKFIDAGNYLLFDVEFRFLDSHPERQAKFFVPQIIRDSNGKEIEVTTPTIFIVLLSKIIHLFATLLMQYDPDIGYDKFQKLNFEDNVDLEGLSIRDYHTVDFLDQMLKDKLHHLRHTPIQTLPAFKSAMKEYQEISGA